MAMTASRLSMTESGGDVLVYAFAYDAVARLLFSAERISPHTRAATSFKILAS